MNLTTTFAYMLMFYGAYSLTADAKRKFKDLWKKNKKDIKRMWEVVGV